MKLSFILPALFLVFPLTTYAQETTSQPQIQTTANPPICLIEGTPSAEHYKSIKRIKAAKRNLWWL